jgi:hypothetical protein
MNPLVVEAMKKAAIAWLTVGELPAYAVWCLWVDDALYVVSGPDEQPAPGLARASVATVTARGDHGGRIVSWPAAVSRLEPGSELWTTVVPQLTAKRLNSTAGAELEQHWAAGCVVNRLVPAGDDLPELPDGSLAAPVPPTPAARATRRPFRLHRVKGASNR